MTVLTPPNLELTIGPLSVKILGLQFPKAEDYWDSNWLFVDICCSDLERSASRLGCPCLRTDELRDFKNGVTSFLAGSADARLNPMEPYFSLEICRSEQSNMNEVFTGIREKHVKEPVFFRFNASNAEVSDLALQLEDVCSNYPVKRFANGE